MPHLPAWAALSVVLAVSPSPAPSSSLPPSVMPAVRIAYVLRAPSHYVIAVKMTHIISNDLKGALRAMAGSKADPVTIIEDHTADLSIDRAGAAVENFVDVRHYGGLQAKDTSVVRRTAVYKGSIGADGRRTPSDEPLVDPGDGALAELPAGPIAIGQTWSFTRSVLIDRDLGHGTITYTDTLLRLDGRAGKAIAVIGVTGKGRVDVADDLKSRGFGQSDIVLQGTAEFDTATGLPGAQHYTAHAQWNTRVMWVHFGIIFDDTYDAAPWTQAAS